MVSEGVKKWAQKCMSFSIFIKKRVPFQPAAARPGGLYFCIKNHEFVLVSDRYGVYRLDPKNMFFLFFSGQNLDWFLIGMDDIGKA